MADLETQIATALVHLEYLRDGQDRANEHLQKLNGRVGTVEDDVIRIKADAKADAKISGRNHGASWGAIGGGAMAGAMWVWHTLAGGK